MNKTTHNMTKITSLKGQLLKCALAALMLCGGMTAQAQTTPHATGIDDNVVYINDLEPHTWSYYSDASLPDSLRSLNPADVKITYLGNGTNTVADGNGTYNSSTSDKVKVGIDADAHTFVYYKTLERVDGRTSQSPTGRCKYITIPNPFSVRPTYGTVTSSNVSTFSGWRGFAGWRVKSVSKGKIYDAATDGTEYSTGSTIAAEATVYFAPDGETGMAVELEALWASAILTTSNATTNFTNTSYERNFMVITGNIEAPAQAANKPYTLMGLYPNGTTNGYTTATAIPTNYARPEISISSDLKIEYIKIYTRTSTNRTTYSLNGNGYNLTIGRGVSARNSYYCAHNLYGVNAETTNKFTLRVESGTYYNLYFMGSGAANNNRVTTGLMTAIIGSDYDRVAGTNGTNDNSKLTVSHDILVSNTCRVGSNGNSGKEVFRCTVKSGNFDLGNYGGNVQFYFSSAGSSYVYGKRTAIIEGGNFSDVSGGMENNNNGDVLMFDLRITGGTFNSIVYGAAQNAAASGNRRFIITGGDFKGWIAGGANGTNTTGGALNGSTHIYFGGDATCISANNNTIGPGQATGGNIFGAGSGNASASTTATVGQVDNSTVVIADECEVEHCVYGGGNYGFVSDGTTHKSDIRILGGVVHEKVFGGSNNQRGQNVEIKMTGGIVEGGVYGGSNSNGNINYDVTMNINGGQIGKISGGNITPGYIHGGGYGSSTRVLGDVNLTLGVLNATSGVTVYGDVYGGSAEGKTNGNTSRTSGKVTNVTLNAGTIYGSLYGGGLGVANGSQADVWGPVAVTVNGGSVKKTDSNGANGSGGVYGANNVNGAPQQSVTVDIYGTDAAPSENEYALFAVYGGGNAADYTYANGYPKVTVHNCDNSIEYVYGGGNAAAVSATDVTIYGGNKIGNVFGGGNGISGTAANVNGATNVKIYGGTILNVYGGSNKTGTISGAISVTVDSTAENGSGCLMNIGSVYGGGNMAASSVGSITIGCTGNKGHIENVFGGANQADITGSINLQINGGDIGNVFGGNNADGGISGTITVTVGNNPSGCPVFKIGNVYGGGNLAKYGNADDNKGNYPVVNIQSGTITTGVYGGGLGNTAIVYGNPQVNVTGGTIGSVYGGGNAAAVTGSTNVSIATATVTGSVFGGGNAAGISGTTTVGVSSGSIGTGIYGGCNTEGNVGSTATVNITGGTIGSAQTSANIHGGGYGYQTRVIGSVFVNLSNATVNGDVYGGSAEGKTNGNTSRTAGAKTIVTMNSGTITGSIYGGGLGTSSHPADVWGPDTLIIKKGSTVQTNVYGGNNAYGSPQVSIDVIVEGPTVAEAATTPLVLNNVYGGGNEADVSANCTAPHVNIKGCGTSVTRAFGGGNAAEVPATNIEIHGGTFDYVFGGGNGERGALYGADVTGNVNLTIYGGTINEVFAGSNANGTIGGSMNVYINSENNNNCGIEIASLYGGGNQAEGKPGTFTINNCAAVIDTIYGGSKAAAVTGDIALNITKGQIGSVFGGNNKSGAISGTIAVTVNLDNCASLDNVFGGGNQAPYSGTPSVTLTNGTVNHSVYGGGNEAGVGGSLVYINGGRVMDGIFGGCNSSGTVTGNIAVYINGGTQGVQGTPMTKGIFGGGYGAGTGTNGNVTVNIGNGSNTPSIYGDIYGGSALGSVNDAAADTTTVNVLSGTVNGNIYGGGLGQTGGANVAKGQVNGKVIVNIGATDGAQTPNYSGSATINGSVYGCNNTNGSPKADVTVNVYKTAHTEKNVASYTENDATYAIDQVFGGGNQADYSPTSNASRATVNVYTCLNTIRRVFGGGNAAAAYGVVTTIDGGRFDYIFGGGNGEGAHAANIGAGGTNLTVNSGVINYLFGGSNETGTINGPMGVTVNNTGCTEDIKNFFAGGNLAVIGSAEHPVNLSTTIACGTNFDAVYGGSNLADIYGNVTLTINGGTISEVYAGSKGRAAAQGVEAKAANIYGNTTLNIYAGAIGSAFGGSNINGNITDTITVNVDWSQSDCAQKSIDTVFGASNLATYTPTTPGNYPAVNIKHGTVSGSVFGAGNGDPNDASKGIVTSNPVVTIGDANASHYAIVSGNVYGGGNNAAVSGNTTVTYNDNNASSTVAKLFGGGNAANVSDTATVTLTTGTVTGGVYGGCNSRGSVGVVTVALNGGQVGATGNGNAADVYGGGYGHNTSTTGNIGVTLNGTTVYGDIYGGSALGGVNSTASDTTTVTLSSATLYGSVFGGGKGDANDTAVSNGKAIVNINVANTNLTGIYGGANIRGNVKGDISVNINANVGSSTSTLDIFGGGYGAATNTEGNVTVTIGNLIGTITPVIYGDIYGGSALGNVNNESTDVTTINFFNGTLKKTTINGVVKGGNIYGGGLGDANNAAKVNGKVMVNISNTEQTVANCKIDLRDATIYGCNNTNGSPQDNVEVHVYKTAYNYSDYPSGDNYTASDGADPYYAIDQVFGGGNRANYAPENGAANSTKKATVYIHGCTNTIRRVFGGGNAAAAYGVVTTIDGGRFDYIFGGGNGEAQAANIGAGGTDLTVNSGIINYLFGGSNEQGSITGPMGVEINNTGCTEDIKNFFAGGNLAIIGSNEHPVDLSTTIACGTNFDTVYGGSNLADIYGNVTLTIKGGTIDAVFAGSKGRAADQANSITAKPADIHGTTILNIYGGVLGDAFGGSNINGNITGSITVNMDWSQAPDECDDASDLHINNVFGASNLATYTPTTPGDYPAVNIKHGTVTNSVYGAGNGDPNDASKGIVTSNPVVTIGDANASHYAIVSGNVYGGGNNAAVSGNTTVTYNDNNASSTVAKLFGGGNAANVSGTTTVTMTNGKVTAGIYGGCNSQGSVGAVTVALNGGQVGATGAGNSANVYGGGYGHNTSTTANIGVTLGNTTVYGDIYGGSALGSVNGSTSNTTTITIGGANLHGTVYGGGMGSGTGDATRATSNGNVIINYNIENTALVDGIYGGANVNGLVSGNITVNISANVGATGNGYSRNIFGGGLGAATATDGNVTVTIGDGSTPTIWGDIYGGSAFGEVGATGKTAKVDFKNGTLNGVIYGGGKGQTSPTSIAATVSGGTEVLVSNGTIKNGIYGGCNANGTVNGKVTVTVNGGTIGTDANTTANVHGGGYGSSTATGDTVTVTIGNGSTTPIIWGDVYGGSALGNVNDNVNELTKVWLKSGTINGSLYGGGLGNISNPALVNGKVQVVVDGGSVLTTTNSSNTTGSVFGCNNVNGTPKGTVEVTINRTTATVVDPGTGAKTYALQAVYGGGNLAHYDPTTASTYPTVTINNCTTSVKDVFGGGNAAAVPYTSVTINGGDIDHVFAGGNGESGTAANVGYKNSDDTPSSNEYGTGSANLLIKGGTINQVFGGSNSKGTIRTSGTLSINKPTSGEGLCDMIIGEVYGGGNIAPGAATTVNIGCTGSIVDGENGHVAHPENIGTSLEGIGNVYGGANEADVSNNISLTISGGIIRNAFGGNNQSGAISGTIAVTINKSASCGWYVGNVYGGGNEAPYGGVSDNKGNYPVVNVLNGTVTNNVYGGGLGATAIVYGNPQVTIGDNDANHSSYVATVGGDVYGGGDAAAVVGTPVVHVVNKCNTSIANVYGGGNAADVSATSVTIDGGTITGMVFGGGHGDKDANPQKEANVTSDVSVNVTGGTINKVFGGSNSKGSIGGSITLNVAKGNNSCDMHITEVYGGGNHAAGNAGTITIGCTGTASEGIGDVYGGANAANINSDITLNITGGKIGRVFGGNNASGAISGNIIVNVEWSGSCSVNSLGSVFGGGNQAAYGDVEHNKGNYPQVNIKNGTVTNNVYGGGLGNTAIVYGNPQVTIGDLTSGHETYVATVGGDVYGGGDAAAVTGNTTVTIQKANSSADNLFGGGNAAGVSGTTTVNVNSGSIGTGVYGGCNSSGTVGENIAVNINSNVGSNVSNVDIFGGGYGSSTNTNGSVTVTIGDLAGTKVPTIYGDIYGGSALGNVNDAAADLTKVDFLNGTLHGTIYGGGLGDATYAAKVNGQVQVNISSSSQQIDNCHIDLRGCTIYGCNNTNGSPQDNVAVNIYKTGYTTGDYASQTGSLYAIDQVFGGGNEADYLPENGLASSSKKTTVHIYDCLNTIRRVFAGGNAAAATGVASIIEGGRFGYVFGGGNGEVTEANIGLGGTNMTIHAGIINELFGGSNQHGSIAGTSVTNIDGDNIGASCAQTIDEFFGGGNAADITGNVSTIIDCGTGLIGDIYGGSNQANITGNVSLTIEGGDFDKVFGGSKGSAGQAANIDGNVTLILHGGDIDTAFGGCNVNGNITGSITVTVDSNRTTCPLTLNYVYGGGKDAAYTPNPVDTDDDDVADATPISPVVNILQGTVNIDVFGGGLGSGATVTANPQVNVGVYPARKVKVGRNVFGGGSMAAVNGNTAINVRGSKTVVVDNVYGGGNQATVSGSTDVQVGGTPATEP